jgi:site-specific DNA-methyltransferase (adenine-specific)
VIINGDSREILADMIERGETVHSIVTDPPYGLVSVVKRFGKEGSAPAKSNGATGVYKRASAGFMGQAWDGTGIEKDPVFWRLCYDVLLPGGHMLAFGGTRTWHRIACAIEDAGFEVRDCFMWLYGTGFPKSHNQGEGRGTALKPAWEPIFMFRKPLIGTVAANVLAHGTGALNIGACFIGAEGGTKWVPVGDKGDRGQFGGGIKDGAIADAGRGRWPANLIGDDDLPQDFWRFFYTTKASKKDRNSDWHGNPLPYPNAHPTVKPADLMQWLVRLVTPPGGVVLDPFAGSGSTGVAARREGFRFIGIEQDPRHADFATMRVGGSDFEAKLARLREAIRRNEEARDAAR